MGGRIYPLSDKDISNALAANAAGAFVLVGNPLGSQPISVIFAAGWDGGDVTIVGTAINPQTLVTEAWTEVVASAAGTTVETVRSFVTVTSATKSAGGATANTAQLRALFPTRAPYRLGGNVAGGQQIHANLYILKGFVTTGTVELSILFWEDGRWWVQPGGPLTVADTDINKSKVGRFVSIADPSTDLHLWLASTGTLDKAFLYGKMGAL